ncbi:MAG: ribonuclease HII [Patescibacteria group bacterium]
MAKPTFEYENKLVDSGFTNICGIDEVGRGPLAGPVVASAVIISAELFKDSSKFKSINDSKKLSEKSREKWHDFLTKREKIKWGIGIVSEKIIDRINILEATKLAMMEAIKMLVRQPADMPASAMFQRGEPDFLLIDGNFTLEIPDLSQKAIPRGDAKVISIAAASIIAKVTRDRMMRQYHEDYPEYGFDKHKGYGTAMHIEMIKKYGPCAIHRKSFEPIKGMMKFVKSKSL